MKFFILLISCVCAQLYHENEYISLFKDFIDTYKKDYHHDEFHYRYEIFKRNVDFVKVHNSGFHSYTVAINQFSDLTLDEFRFLYLRPRKNGKSSSTNYLEEEGLTDIKLPDAVDWSSNNNPMGKSIVNSIRTQGHCGSCWAFAAVCAIEGACAQSQQILRQLSEQELVDCSKGDGCDGGFMDDAFQYAIESRGLTLRSSYPYLGLNNDCRMKQFPHYCAIRNFKDIPENNLFGLLATSSKRIVAVGIQADSMSFQFYKSGIYDDPRCGTDLNHGMALVGYGNENGKLYWKLRNSWGVNWGSFGYMYLERTEDILGSGACGIALAASYPLT